MAPSAWDTLSDPIPARARQVLRQMDKPHYDHIRGLSPTIAIEQKSASSNPRSTVGTITEICDYLRVLYARVGVQHCPGCDARVESHLILTRFCASKLTSVGSAESSCSRGW